MNRAFDYGSKGYRFESYWDHKVSEEKSSETFFMLCPARISREFRWQVEKRCKYRPNFSPFFKMTVGVKIRLFLHGITNTENIACSIRNFSNDEYLNRHVVRQVAQYGGRGQPTASGSGRCLPETSSRGSEDAGNARRAERSAAE